MSLQRRVYGFIPTSITGCALWLDGADPAGNGVIPANGATVSTWVDKSGNGKNATATGTPTYLTGGGVNFNGSPYFLNQTFSQNLSQRSIFIVMQETVHNNYFGVFPIIPSPNTAGGGDGGEVTGLSIETTNGLTFYGANGGYSSFMGNSTLLAKSIYNDNMNGTSGSGFLNGNSATTNTASYTAGTCSGYGIGGRWLSGAMNASYRLNGVIFEIMYFNSPLGTTDRRNVEAYLAQKWGLRSSLPLGHPGLGETIYRADYTKQNAMTARPFYTAFSPRQISGCALWLDGADPAGNGVIPANNDAVSTWVDKSGNGRNGSQVNNPTYDLTRKAIYFTGSAQYYTLPDSTFPTGDSSYTYFIIANFTSLGPTPNWVGVLGGGGFTPSTSIAFRTNGVGGGFYEYWYANDILSSTTYATNQIVAIQSIYTSGGQRSLIQNFSIFTTNTPSTPRNQSAGNNVIGRTFSTEYMQGYIHEVIVYNFDLSTTQRQQVESYLAQKWGLTASLPGGHLNATQPAGAITLTALTNFRILSRSRGSPITSTTLNTIATYLRNYVSEFRNPSFYGYNLDGNSYHINDGGGDMYDAGNWTYPWLISGTQYTNANGNSQQAFSIDYSSTTATTVDTDFVYASLGYAASSGTTITSNHPLTVLGFRTTTGRPVGFQLGGNSGADGGGTLASGILYAGDIIQGFTVHAFYRETYNAGDPSHCNLFILLGHPSWISVFGTISSFADPVANGGNGCFFYTSGAGVSNILAIQTLLSKSGGILVTAAECQTVVQAFVNRVKLAVGF